MRVKIPVQSCGSTHVTNFCASERAKYEKAIEQFQGTYCRRLVIKEEAYDIHGNLLEGWNSLHDMYKGTTCGLNRFWDIFDNMLV